MSVIGANGQALTDPNTGKPITGQVMTIGGSKPIVDANGNPIQTGGGGLAPWTVITTTQTLTAGSQYLANTIGGSFTVTLPASPVLGDMIVLSDDYNWYLNNLRWLGE